MSATQAFVRTFHVAGFTAEVSFPTLALGAVSLAVVEWSPRVPDFHRDFTRAQRLTYQRLLSEAIGEAQCN